jgi:hypothetical protein
MGSVRYDVSYCNGVRLGELLWEVDGQFVFYPVRNGGAWTAHVLREIADKLERLNAR